MTQLNQELTSNLSWIPKGNTHFGVHQAVVEEILNRSISLDSVLDVPAGEGEFLSTLKKIASEAQVHGLDLYSSPKGQAEHWIQKKSVLEWSGEVGQKEKFDLVTCISGVMCFDGLESFFQKANVSLKPGGWFIVTNDNVGTLRDRIHYLFFGHPKRFRMMFDENEGNWNCVLPQALVKWLWKSGFEIEKVRYVHQRPEDFIFIPLALPFFVIQWLKLISKKGPWPQKLKAQMFSYPSFFRRHYIIVARKKG